MSLLSLPEPNTGLREVNPVPPIVQPELEKNTTVEWSTVGVVAIEILAPVAKWLAPTTIGVPVSALL
jgi:hypothetical protein